MMKQETNVDILKNRIQHHGATDEDWNKAKLQIKQELAERKKQKVKAAEERRLWEIEQMKPEVFVPYEVQSMHVPENLADFENKCAKCNLNDLIRYTNEVKAGLHKQDFRGRDTTPVVQFLEAQIAKRKKGIANGLLEIAKKAEKTIKNSENIVNQIHQKLNIDQPTTTEKKAITKPKPEYSR